MTASARRTFEQLTPARNWLAKRSRSRRLGPLSRVWRALPALLGSLIWLSLYAWLALRLWDAEIINDRLNWLLGLAIIVLGVLLGIAWWRVWERMLRAWRGRRAQSKWVPLRQEQLLSLTPSQFEEYVAQRIFARQGYTVENTPDVKDGGVDILLLDEYGRRSIVQCKRYKGTVGSSTVRELYGTMIHHGAVEAFLATAGPISSDARAWAEGKPIRLLDGDAIERLARLPTHAVQSNSA